MIAVHCGAGYHNSNNRRRYNRLSKKACIQAINVLKNGGNALEAAKAAIIILENDPLTNAGYGSNLTSDGTVEADASIMDGSSLNFGGCGAVKKLKNPIELAYNICSKQSAPLPLGLIPPALLVGQGGLQHARAEGLKIVANKALISPKALKQYQKFKQMLQCHNENKLLDTVGAVCVDQSGNMAAASSSGGLILKRPGRVGQAALFGSGTWADSFNKQEPSVAVCTSGCGEHLIQTQLAKQIADDLKLQEDCPTTRLHKSITERFIKSRFVRHVEQKLAGALALFRDNQSGEMALLWGHTTESMSVGYMALNSTKAVAMVSVLPEDAVVGKTVTVGGTYVYAKK